MKIFTLGNSGWEMYATHYLCHNDKNANLFKEDVKIAMVKIFNNLGENEFTDVSGILVETKNELINMGYSDLKIEESIDIVGEGIIDDEMGDIKEIVGLDVFNAVCNHNHSILKDI